MNGCYITYYDTNNSIDGWKGKGDDDGENDNNKSRSNDHVDIFDNDDLVDAMGGKNWLR